MAAVAANLAGKDVSYEKKTHNIGFVDLNTWVDVCALKARREGGSDSQTDARKVEKAYDDPGFDRAGQAVFSDSLQDGQLRLSVLQARRPKQRQSPHNLQEWWRGNSGPIDRRRQDNTLSAQNKAGDNNQPDETG